MSKVKFERKKPHVNVGTIGHVDHGKTTLTAALTKVMAETHGGQFMAYDQIDKAPEEKARGIIKVNDEVEIVGLKATQKTTCTGVEMFRKLLDQGEAGDNVGVLLRGTKREEVERGQVLAKPGSITPHTHFESEVYVLTKEEGGRHTPFFKGYRPQFYFRTTDVTGTIELPAGVEMVMPGDNIKMNVELISPIAMEEGLRFAIREGGRTVGAGVVAKILK